jgi:hypothetical protein
VVRGRRRSCRHQADGRTGPNAGQTAGPAPRLGERILCLELASVQARPLQDQHSTPWERAASGATGGAQPLPIVTTKAATKRWQFDLAASCSTMTMSIGLRHHSSLRRSHSLPRREMIAIGSRPLSWERSQGRSAVLLEGSEYGGTIQMRYSMPREAARADSPYSHIGRHD